jgi:hypothetical protein
MRATLTVAAPEGPNKPCKVTVKLWDVPRALLRKLADVCDNREGSTYRRELLDGGVDIVCNFLEKSVTLVKPSSDIHGLQARFGALVGKSLVHRMAPLQEAARKCAADGKLTTQEGNLDGCSVDDLFNSIHLAAAAAAKPVLAPDKKQRRPKKKRRTDNPVVAA